MFRLSGAGMMETEKGMINIAWHGEVDGAVVVIPS